MSPLPYFLFFRTDGESLALVGREGKWERERERPVRNKLCSFRGLNPKLHMRSWEGGACTYDVRTGSGGGYPKSIQE